MSTCRPTCRRGCTHLHAWVDMFLPRRKRPDAGRPGAESVLPAGHGAARQLQRAHSHGGIVGSQPHPPAAATVAHQRSLPANFVLELAGSAACSHAQQASGSMGAPAQWAVQQWPSQAAWQHKSSNSGAAQQHAPASGNMQAQQQHRLHVRHWGQQEQQGYQPSAPAAALSQAQQQEGALQEEPGLRDSQDVILIPSGCGAQHHDMDAGLLTSMAEAHAPSSARQVGPLPADMLCPHHFHLGRQRVRSCRMEMLQCCRGHAPCVSGNGTRQMRMTAAMACCQLGLSLQGHNAAVSAAGWSCCISALLVCDKAFLTSGGTW